MTEEAEGAPPPVALPVQAKVRAILGDQPLVVLTLTTPYGPLSYPLEPGIALEFSAALRKAATEADALPELARPRRGLFVPR